MNKAEPQFIFADRVFQIDKPPDSSGWHYITIEYDEDIGKICIDGNLAVVTRWDKQPIELKQSYSYWCQGHEHLEYLRDRRWDIVQRILEKLSIEKQITFSVCVKSPLK